MFVAQYGMAQPHVFNADANTNTTSRKYKYKYKYKCKYKQNENTNTITQLCAMHCALVKLCVKYLSVSCQAAQLCLKLNRHLISLSTLYLQCQTFFFHSHRTASSVVRFGELPEKSGFNWLQSQKLAAAVFLSV